MSDVKHTNLHYSLYKNLFISEADARTIRDFAALELASDPLHSVPNAYILAVLNFIDGLGRFDGTGLCIVSAQRRAELADRALTSRK